MADLVRGGQSGPHQPESKYLGLPSAVTGTQHNTPTSGNDVFRRQPLSPNCANMNQSYAATTVIKPVRAYIATAHVSSR